MANEVRLIDANKLPITTEFFDDGEYSIDFVYASAIRQAPTIDPESLRPKGHWVDQEWNDMWQSMTATCSNCHERGEVRVKRNEYGLTVINSPCCPNCGAKMEG